MVKYCNYCGYQQDDENDGCECGGTFTYENCNGDKHEFYSWEIEEKMAGYQSDFTYGSEDCKYNNIDNILESKRK